MGHEDTRPTVAVSMGDPAGISPEILVASLPEALRICRPVVFGHLPTLEAAAAGAPLVLSRVDAPRDPGPGEVLVVHTGPDGPPIHEPDDRAAQAQLEALDLAVTAALAGDAAALVTAPMAKETAARVRPDFTGHTEVLARRAGLAPDGVTMVFAADALVVGLVTTHLPLRLAADGITGPRLGRTVDHVIELLRRLGVPAPHRVGVAGVNPHAGEGGLLGAEERDLIAPFVASHRAPRGVELTGPVPAESLFREALVGGYAGVVAMYHDQAMIPLKLGGVGTTANITMGLPFPRVSPDHGVAYDIARAGRADPKGMIRAFELAARLASRPAEIED